MAGWVQGGRRALAVPLRAQLERSAWPPAALLAVYGLVLLATFNQVVGGIYLSADAASAPVIADLLDEAPPDRAVILGNYPWYEILWLELATGWLPYHRQIWEVIPYALVLGGIAALAWSAWRVAGLGAALVAVVPLVCAGEGLLNFLAGPTAHSAAVLHVALLGAFLVWARPAARTLPALAAAGVALALVTGAGLASDSLVAFAGLIPFVLVGLLIAATERTRRSLLLGGAVLAVAAASAGVAVAATALMEHQDIAKWPGFLITFVPTRTLGKNVRLLVESFAFMGGGEPFGRKVDAQSVWEAVQAAVALAGLVAAFAVARGLVRALLAAPSRALTARDVYGLFWAAVLVCNVAIFVLSNVPVNVYTGRYLLPAVFAVAALLPLFAERGAIARWGVTAGVCLVAAGGLVTLVRGDIEDNIGGFPTGTEAGLLEAFAREQGVKIGYAHYWPAASLTWATHDRVHVFPVLVCGPQHGLCRWHQHIISSWHQPRPRTRSMLILDARRPELGGVDPRFGKPRATRQIGGLTVYVFERDIARFIAGPAV